MNEYILLMHGDAVDQQAADDAEAWGHYLSGLRATGGFDGGSSISGGERLRKGLAPQAAAQHITGFMRVRAESLDAAKRFLQGNPVYEAGGTVEIRELPRD